MKESELFQFIKTEDIPYEEDCLRNPFQVKSWIRYLEFKKDSTHQERVFILSRAVKELPRSYKLWKLLLELKMDRILTGKAVDFIRDVNPEFPPDHQEWQLVNSDFENCLVLCNKYPRIWIMYCTFLLHQKGRTTFTRRVFDAALKALPVTQHKDLWEVYLAFAQKAGGETAIRIWRRFLKVQPSHAERYCNVLLDFKPPRTAEAARVLTAIIESPQKYSNPNGKTLYQYWTLLCQLIIDHPEGIEMPQQDHLVPQPEFALTERPDHLDVELILRTGIKKFSDQVGVLWNSLAKWFILQGDFERARDVYEEGLESVTTLKDFTLIFDAYAKTEEGVLADAMATLEEYRDQELPEDAFDEIEVDLRLARYEDLINRRPFLVNDVLLRQNPHSVADWKARVKLYFDKEDYENVVYTYTKACQTVSPQRATGKLTDLWIEFAKFYEEQDMIEDARNIFEQSTQVQFRKVEDLAHMWCQWAEMEIRLGDFQNAIDIIGRATSPLSSNRNIRYTDDSISPQMRLFKCVKLWSFYADLEESVGTVESTKAVYDRILELKIATPQTIINYASFLEEHNFFEESFRVYERGIELFGYPVAFEIWNLYLTKFINRYKGDKLERARDLFEQALDKCPTEFAKPLYLLYAKLEEDYGLARHALKIYDRGTQAVGLEDLYEMYNIYIAKAASFYGIISTREIYTKALEVLPDKHARDIAIKFADMETKLGEVDRARAIFAYASQLCNPTTDIGYWSAWHEFEVKFGNEDTYKEMLRIKRSVQLKFDSDVGFIAQQILASRGIDVQKTELDDSGKPKVTGFVRAKDSEVNPDEIEVSNPNEIEIDEESDDDEIVAAAVPNSVFGSLAVEPSEEPIGAKDRFKKRKRDIEPE